MPAHETELRVELDKAEEFDVRAAYGRERQHEAELMIQSINDRLRAGGGFRYFVISTGREITFEVGTVDGEHKDYTTDRGES